MTKRICYIHVGPHKTGTSSIQWFLQENRAELLEHGYFVPESETKRGAHHALAEGLRARRCFATDVTEEFTPNGFEMHRPDWFTARRLRRAIRAIKARGDEILQDPALAVEAPWNDLAHRSGLISRE